MFKQTFDKKHINARTIEFNGQFVAKALILGVLASAKCLNDYLIFRQKKTLTEKSASAFEKL